MRNASLVLAGLVGVAIASGVYVSAATAETPPPRVAKESDKTPPPEEVENGAPIPGTNFYSQTGDKLDEISRGPVPTAAVGLDVGVGKDGSVWRVDNAKNISRGYQTVQGAASDISVGPSGDAWVVNSDTRKIFHWKGTGWDELPGEARDIAVGASGVAWVIGMDGTPHKWNATQKSWTRGTGGGTRIAVDPTGNPWVVNANNEIWQFTAGAWKQLPGAGTDIAIAPDGTAFVVGAGGQVYKWNGSAWSEVPGVKGKRIAAASATKIYVTQ